MSSPARCIPRSSASATDRCPKCGMKLVPAGLVESGKHEHHGHHGGHGGEGHQHHVEHGHHGHSHGHDSAQGIEWEDDMVEVNRMTTPANMRWKLVDRETGAENAPSTGGSASATA